MPQKIEFIFVGQEQPGNLSTIFDGIFHHVYDVSSKDAFYIIDMAAGIFLCENFAS